MVSYHNVVVLSSFCVCICEAVVKLVTGSRGVARVFFAVWTGMDLFCFGRSDATGIEPTFV